MSAQLHYLVKREGKVEKEDGRLNKQCGVNEEKCNSSFQVFTSTTSCLIIS